MAKLDWNLIFDRFQDVKVLVIGDAMIDSYMWGQIERQSPEAPIPIVNVKRFENRLGGAANVAVNLQSLGATPIICTVIGENDKGFLSLLENQGLSQEGILQEDRLTTVKTRIISEGKHQLRVDEEDTYDIASEDKFIDLCCSLLKKADVVILQDYNKGVLTKKTITNIITSANNKNIPVLVDPKKDNYWNYKNVDLFKPNFKELSENSNSEIKAGINDGLKTEVQRQRQELNAKSVMVTLSEHGVFYKGVEEFSFPVFERNIVDVSGAGDSVIATACLTLATQVPKDKMVQLANLAGGLVCEEVGVVSIEKDKLLAEANRLI